LRQGTLFQSHYPDCRQQNASEKTTSKPEQSKGLHQSGYHQRLRSKTKQHPHNHHPTVATQPPYQ
jgi:hypothetical protein